MILTQYFSDFLQKNICCWYSYELPRLVEAIEMSTNNIRFYKEVDKNTLAVFVIYRLLNCLTVRL